MKNMNKAQRTAMAKRHEQITIACNGYSRRDEGQLKRVAERNKKAQRNFKQNWRQIVAEEEDCYV